MRRWIPWSLLLAAAAAAALLWIRTAPGSVLLGCAAAAAMTAATRSAFTRSIGGSPQAFALAFFGVFGAQAALFAMLSLAAAKTALLALPLLATYGAGVMLSTLGLGISFPAVPARSPA